MVEDLDSDLDSSVTGSSLLSLSLLPPFLPFSLPLWTNKEKINIEKRRRQDQYEKRRQDQYFLKKRRKDQYQEGSCGLEMAGT